MAQQAADKKADKSYLSSAYDSLNPWGGRKSPTPRQDKGKISATVSEAGGPEDPGDHSTTHLYGRSFRTYPADCPPLKVQWFHAVDVAKRKPKLVGGRPVPESEPAKPPGRPKKFSPFSVSDSRTLEGEYQRLLEKAEDSPRRENLEDGFDDRVDAIQASRSDNGEPEDAEHTNVAVNEDFLFDVTIEKRELSPVYWLGPVYEVRRGTWFFQEGSTLRPCEENLASQLEDGYLKVKPWLYPARLGTHSGAGSLTPRGSRENLKGSPSTASPSKATHPSKSMHRSTASGSSVTSSFQPQSHRLFGAYMSNVATYHDAETAWLSTDGMLSWVTSSVYERFSGGGYMSGVKLVRGYAEPAKAQPAKEKGPQVPTMAEGDLLGLDERQQRLLKRRSGPPISGTPGGGTEQKDREQKDREVEARLEDGTSRLQRQLSSLVESEVKTEEEKEEEVRQREEKEIQDDYNTQAGETQNREIEHLILVTHGIGQLLGLRMESLNFVHDVNVLRKTLKSVYANSTDLKALNSELGAGPGNSRVQVLPVCWRHLLDFPKRRERRGEHDLGDVESQEDEYPSLQDITVEGIAFARSLISDLALDVLLYQSSYRDEITRIVLGECNRIARLFRDRNPSFKGKVHVMGHSLGSAILFDILCRQPDTGSGNGKDPLRFWPSSNRQPPRRNSLEFEFEVDDFYCLGSPIGLFQMLKGRTIAARKSPYAAPSESPLNPELVNDPFLAASGAGGDVLDFGEPSSSISSPKTGQLFNIFHPSDPISYRLEPLISPAMASLKPQVLPYTKRGLFGNVAPQGLTGFGAKVGQSVSGLWSSFSAGITSNLINRSLGLTNEDVARMTTSAQKAKSRGQVSETDASHPLPANTEDQRDPGDSASQRKKQLAESDVTKGGDGNELTLIDDELETLYSKFQKRQDERYKGSTADKIQGDDRKAQKMRVEEGKVRALNRNGRVDYIIQESALDFNPMNTLASHLSYWTDEDVSHFVLSQLLSHRVRENRI